MLADLSHSDRSDIWVRTPTDAVLDVVDPALAAELTPGARPIKLDRGVFDASAISLVSRQSVSAISGLVGRELDARRFRANVVLEADGAFPEDEWIGATLEIGSLGSASTDATSDACSSTS